MQKSLLIIGAGYVGGELARQALANGWQVFAVTKSGEGGQLSADVSSLESLQVLSSTIGSVDVIVHCASSGRGGAEAYEAVFFRGVMNVQSVFPEVPLVFVSSTSVYAQVNGEVVSEDSIANPDRATGKVLKKTEDLVLRSGGVVARLAGIYGAGRSILIKKLLKREATIEEDGRRIINQINRDDAASALFHLARLLEDGQIRGECYNVSDSNPRSQGDTYKGLCELLSLPLPPVGERNLNKKRGWTHKAVSNEKLQETGWVPQYPDFFDAAPSVASSLKLS